MHGDIVRLVTGTRDNSPMLLAIALVAMLWTSSGAIGVIERCESRMLDCKRHDVVTGRIRNILLGAAIAIMVIAATGAAPVIGDVADALNLRAALPGWLFVVLNTLGSIVLFAFVYHWAPRSRPRFRACILGAVPAGHRDPGGPGVRRAVLRRDRRVRGRAAVPAARGDPVGALRDLARDAGRAPGSRSAASCASAGARRPARPAGARRRRLTPQRSKTVA